MWKPKSLGCTKCGRGSFYCGCPKRARGGTASSSERDGLQADIIENAAIVENVPLGGRSDAAVEGGGLEEVGEAARRVAEVAVEGDAWIELRLGDADLGTLGGGLALGAANIGPAAQQISG